VFVGREREVSQLREALARARAGSGGVVLLAGDAGIGKTTLTAELARRVHDAGATVLAGRSPRETVVPYQPFLEAFRHWALNALLPALRASTRESGPELARLIPELRRRAPDLPSPDHIVVKHHLARVRQAIAAGSADWNAVRRSKLPIEGGSLKRAPKGYPADHPLIDDLKRTIAKTGAKNVEPVLGTITDPHLPELQVVSEGVCAPRRFLDLVRDFLVFEDEGGSRLAKKMAGYHQFHAVNKAVAATIDAASPVGDRRVGVVWHTQVSGKSLSMAFYAGKIIQRPEMANPTLVVLTDRNDLDEQLFGTFASCQELLRQTPEQAMDRSHLRDLLRVASGGV